MNLDYIPNMNADVENIILQFKLDLDYADKHKKQMKKIFTEMRKKQTCIKCKKNKKQYHIFNLNNPDKYIQSPLCASCLLDITVCCILDCDDVFSFLDEFD